MDTQPKKSGSNVTLIAIVGLFVVAAVGTGVYVYSTNRGRSDQLKADEQGRQRDEVLNRAVAEKGKLPTAVGTPTTVPALPK